MTDEEKRNKLFDEVQQVIRNSLIQAFIAALEAVEVKNEG